MTTRWVLVANSSSAKIFEIKNMGKSVKKIEDRKHELGRRKTRDVYSDRPGRTHMAMGASNRSSYEQEMDPREHEQVVFAKELSGVLENGRTQRSFDELVLVAPPQFLGKLNQAMSTPLKSTVSREFHKDLSDSLNERDVIDHILGYLDLQ